MGGLAPPAHRAGLFPSGAPGSAPKLVELQALSLREPATSDDGSGALAERDRLEHALGGLTLEQRAVIVLHFHLGLPLTEAAQILDVPIGTAKSRLDRGLEAMRAALRAEPDAPPIGLLERAP